MNQSCFLRKVTPNTEAYFGQFMAMLEKQILARAILESKKKIEGNYAFFRNLRSCKINNNVHGILLQIEALSYLGKMRGYTQFSFWIPITLTKICVSCIVINRSKYLCFIGYCFSNHPDMSRTYAKESTVNLIA